MSATLSASFSPASVGVQIQGQSMGAGVRESERVPVPGPQGEPGFSPIVSVDPISGGMEVTITDEGGDHVFDVMDGKDGKDGETGRTPEIFTTAVRLPPGSSAYANTTGTIEQPLITFGIPEGVPGQDGTDGKNGENGKDGKNGTDGVSPGVTVAAITGGHSVTITDADHPGGQTFNVMDGEQGAPGTTDYNELQNKPTIPSKTSDLANDIGFISGLYIASYGQSTFADIKAAHLSNKIVYCRASSNSNPGTGNQLRMAFLAYVGTSESSPTSFEFQYYRSVSTHSESQQGDQVFVYKIEANGTWSVTTREAMSKIVAGSGLSSSYNNGVLTLALDVPNALGVSF